MKSIIDLQFMSIEGIATLIVLSPESWILVVKAIHQTRSTSTITMAMNEGAIHRLTVPGSLYNKRSIIRATRSTVCTFIKPIKRRKTNDVLQ